MCSNSTSFILYLEVIFINISIALNVTKENTIVMQELILKLVMAGVVSQEAAREFFVKAERLRGIEIK